MRIPYSAWKTSLSGNCSSCTTVHDTPAEDEPSSSGPCMSTIDSAAAPHQSDTVGNGPVITLSATFMTKVSKLKSSDVEPDLTLISAHTAGNPLSRTNVAGLVVEDECCQAECHARYLELPFRFVAPSCVGEIPGASLSPHSTLKLRVSFGWL